MGGVLEKARDYKVKEASQVVNGHRHGIVSMQGWRYEMEDAHSSVTQLDNDTFKEWSFYAVYDGHSGSGVSNYCSENLLDTIRRTDDFKKINQGVQDAELVQNISAALVKGFLQLDKEMREKPIDPSEEDSSGSTAVCVLISPTHVFIANCGDSRAVLYTNGAIKIHTQDHKPMIQKEKERIQQAGGTVLIGRVNGTLAVSRALGDFEYKCVKEKGETEQLVSPEPDVYVETRNTEGDEFIILACDGIWDVMSNEDLCKFVRYQLTITEDLSQVAANIVDVCLFRGSKDNMSIIIVVFPAAPKVSQEAVDKEQNFEENIKKKATEIMKTDPDAGTSRIVNILKGEQIPDAPPDSLIESKWPLIESLIEAKRNKEDAVASLDEQQHST